MLFHRFSSPFFSFPQLDLDLLFPKKKTFPRSSLQVAAMHAAALEQDAGAFDYDGVYEEMKAENKNGKKTLVGGSSSKAGEETARR